LSRRRDLGIHVIRRLTGPDGVFNGLLLSFA